MPEMKLTERRIAELMPPVGKDYERYWDTEVAGLCVKVLSSGKKVYNFKDRIGGKTIWGKRMPKCSETTIADMRNTAIQWKAQIRRGENPWHLPEEVTTPTVHELCMENLAVMTERKIRPLSRRHLKDCRLATDWVGKEALGRRLITDVTVAEAEGFLRQFPERRAEHLRAWLRNCYNFAINRSYVDLGFNPWKYCERKYELPDTEELPRYSDAEIGLIAGYLRAAQEGRLDFKVCPIWVANIWFLIRTGSRPSDSRRIEKSWLMERAGNWIISHRSTKTGRKTLVLSQSHGKELSQLCSWNDSKFLFPGRDGQPLPEKRFYSEYSRMREELALSKPAYAIRRWFARTGRAVFDGDIEPVQQLCGWESTAIAERYAGDDEAFLDALIAENSLVSQAINNRIDEVIAT